MCVCGGGEALNRQHFIEKTGHCKIDWGHSSQFPYWCQLRCYHFSLLLYRIKIPSSFRPTWDLVQMKHVKSLHYLKA